MNKKIQQGFTLIEIMIVVAIIGLLAAIAMVNFQRARMNSNEARVIQDLKMFSTAVENFQAAQNPPGYPLVVGDLTFAIPPYLDQTWNNPNRHFYTWAYITQAPGVTYSMLATPIAGSGINTYCIDHSATVYGSINGIGPPAGTPAGCNGGTPLQY